MKDNQKKYWKGIEELNNDPEFLKNAYNEFPEYLPVKETHPSKSEEGEGTGRRDFLKLLGFGVAAVSLAACETPVKKAIPYLNKPEEIEPGIANWYASSYYNGSDYCSVLVKTREGRPIKIEGNTLSSITKGGTNSRAQASVLSLYDETRLQNFVYKGRDVKVKESNKEYNSIDKDIADALRKADAKGIRIVSGSIYSPSTLKVIEAFKAAYPSTEHVMYDPVSVNAISLANEKSFGKAVIPTYNFAKAKVIAGFNCDFLGSWISPIEFAKGYSVGRRVGNNKKEMSRHYQFESNLSMTGANADYREPIKLSEEGLFLAALYASITGNKVNVPASKESEKLKMLADDLKSAKGESLVVSGTNDVAIQILVNEINQALGNHGSTIDLNRACNLKKGNDAAINALVNDAKNNKIGAVIFFGANPVYDLGNGAELASSLANIPVRISFAEKVDETAEHCNYLCPGYHYLESWNDLEPYTGHFSMVQPTISPIFKGTRAAQESLLVWAGNNTEFYEFIKTNWKNSILKSGFDFEKVIHDGVYELSSGKAITSSDSESASSTVSFSSNLSEISSIISATSKELDKGLQLSVYEKVSVGDGSMSANPWLQEVPDPITKATWGNYVTISFATAKEMKLKSGDVVDLTAGKTSLTLPVVVQPGQAKGTLGIALGYGRKNGGPAKTTIGVNAYPLLNLVNNSHSYTISNVSIAATGGFSQIATTQTHDTVMERQSIVKEALLGDFVKADWQKPYNPTVHTSKGAVKPGEAGTDLWYEHEKVNHLWTMMVDLNTCIGCNACVVGCNAENNVAVVGKEEVINRREMHWMRIDRYYSSDMTKEKAEATGVGMLDMYALMEDPEENPEVVFQPMMCQHCNHAPCETVCPVAATTHSSEGLNQMTYNRCIGTRYCANNCPYKVRRFNWFKYFDNDKFAVNTSMSNVLGKMVLNPDVTVRSRGVMEKCSFCVQRIQEVKLTAKKEKRNIQDGEVVTACASACPTNAITFGDINDKESQVYKQISAENSNRAYTVLEEINTRPNVYYLTKIRNKKA
jgi:MoCo/4Fe-4S cofactor protein with predicted Tat translocation signal